MIPLLLDFQTDGAPVGVDRRGDVFGVLGNGLGQVLFGADLLEPIEEGSPARVRRRGMFVGTAADDLMALAYEGDVIPGTALEIDDIGALALLTWLAISLAFKRSSLAALATFVLVPVYLLFEGQITFAAGFVMIGAFLFYTHRSNIQRLIAGTEPLIGKK